MSILIQLFEGDIHVHVIPSKIPGTCRFDSFLFLLLQLSYMHHERYLCLILLPCPSSVLLSLTRKCAGHIPSSASKRPTTQVPFLGLWHRVKDSLRCVPDPSKRLTNLIALLQHL